MRLAEQLVALPYRRFCGRSIDGHRLGRIKGVGGSGVTFEALGPDGTPEVAKLLRPVRATYDLDEVWREVSALECAAHPAIPEWCGILRDGCAYFVVLSQMPGEALDRWLFERRHTFDAPELARVGGQLADVLVHLHERGVAHGDVRPANILYDGARISLVDFGQSLPANPAARALDVAGFADLMLYLRYSSFEARSSAGDWRSELDLTPAQRRFFEDAFATPSTLTMSEARARFRDAFAVPAA